MKQDIFDFLMLNPNSSHHDIANEFVISEMKAIKLLRRLEADNMIYREILPLGNNRDPDNSVFFVARTKYSTAFKDITATKALKAYLADAEERLEIKGKNKNKEYIRWIVKSSAPLRVERFELAISSQGIFLACC